MRLFSLAFACLVLVGFSGAEQIENGGGLQQGPMQVSNGKRHTIAGIVVNSISSEPIRRALVQLDSGSEQRRSLTDAQGHFEILDALDGPANIRAEKPGYFDPQTISGSSDFPDNGARQIGQATNTLTIFLIPAAKLSGTVLDSDGEPIEGVQVTLLARRIASGRRRWQAQGVASTDQTGGYLFEGQMPEEVLVCSDAHPMPSMGSRSAPVFPARCYPDSPDTSSAQSIRLMAGQTSKADFKLNAVEAFTVSGVFRGGLSGAGYRIWMDNGGRPQYDMFGQIDSATGHFILQSVPKGAWRLHISQSDARGNSFSAVQDISVRGADIANVQLLLQPSVDIPVEIDELVSAEAERNAQQQSTERRHATSVLVRLVPDSENGDPQEYYSSQTPRTNEQLAILGVLPGSYRVMARSQGVGCVDSVYAGGVDLSQETLIVSAGSPVVPIVVGMRQDCASLNLTSHADWPVASRLVLAVPELPSIEPQSLYLSSNEGPGTLVNLTPGAYRIYAVAGAGELPYADKEAMRDMPFQTVTLTPNGKTALTVNVVKRSE